MKYGIRNCQSPSGHPAIEEKTTGIIACGRSWCAGDCGLPALVITWNGREYRGRGDGVACGPVFAPFGGQWKGQKIAATLDETTPEDALKLMWW